MNPRLYLKLLFNWEVKNLLVSTCVRKLYPTNESMWYITHRYMARCCKSHPWVFSTSLITACWSASTPCYKHITQVQTVTLQVHTNTTLLTTHACIFQTTIYNMSVYGETQIWNQRKDHNTVPFKYIFCA